MHSKDQDGCVRTCPSGDFLVDDQAQLGRTHVEIPYVTALMTWINGIGN